jgi:hypothetical protein
VDELVHFVTGRLVAKEVSLKGKVNGDRQASDDVLDLPHRPIGQDDPLTPALTAYVSSWRRFRVESLVGTRLTSVKATSSQSMRTPKSANSPLAWYSVVRSAYLSKPRPSQGTS